METTETGLIGLAVPSVVAVTSRRWRPSRPEATASGAPRKSPGRTPAVEVDPLPRHAKQQRCRVGQGRKCRRSGPAFDDGQAHGYLPQLALHALDRKRQRGQALFDGRLRRNMWKHSP